MRILVLSFETPAYPGGGGQSRQHCLLEPLAGRHDIRVLSTDGPPLFGRLPEGVDVHYLKRPPYVPRPRRSWLARNWDHHVHGPPAAVDEAATSVIALAEAADEQLRSFAPDVVQVEHGEFGDLLSLLAARVPTVLVMHNVVTAMQAQRIGGSAWNRLSGGLETLLMARFERRYVRAADTVVAVNRRDRRAIRMLGRPRRLRVIPNCVPVSHFTRTTDRAERPTVIFSASFHWPPNQAAARELLREVLPRVRAAVPDVELVLAGQQMPDDLAADVASTPGARATGTIDDIRPELHRAWVALAPLRTGSGSPIKVMEALASGVPVVATPRVARMLDVGPADGVLVAASASKVAAAITRLVSDGALREQMAARGPRTAHERFDSARAARLQEEVWEETASAGLRSDTVCAT